MSSRSGGARSFAHPWPGPVSYSRTVCICNGGRSLSMRSRDQEDVSALRYVLHFPVISGLMRAHWPRLYRGGERPVAGNAACVSTHGSIGAGRPRGSASVYGGVLFDAVLLRPKGRGSDGGTHVASPREPAPCGRAMGVRRRNLPKALAPLLMARPPMNGSGEEAPAQDNHVQPQTLHPHAQSAWTSLWIACGRRSAGRDLAPARSHEGSRCDDAQCLARQPDELPLEPRRARLMWEATAAACP